MERRLAAILSADAVGYSGLMGRARGPPMDYGDKLPTQPSRYTFAPPHGRFLLRR